MKVTSYEVFWAFVKSSGNTAGTLATKVGCSRQLMSAIGRKERTCTPELAHKIIAVLGIPVGSMSILFTVHESRNHVRTSTNPRQKKAA